MSNSNRAGRRHFRKVLGTLYWWRFKNDVTQPPADLRGMNIFPKLAIGHAYAYCTCFCFKNWFLELLPYVERKNMRLAGISIIFVALNPSLDFGTIL